MKLYEVILYDYHNSITKSTVTLSVLAESYQDAEKIAFDRMWDEQQRGNYSDSDYTKAISECICSYVETGWTKITGIHYNKQYCDLKEEM